MSYPRGDDNSQVTTLYWIRDKLPPYTPLGALTTLPMLTCQLPILCDSYKSAHEKKQYITDHTYSGLYIGSQKVSLPPTERHLLASDSKSVNTSDSSYRDVGGIKCGFLTSAAGASNFSVCSLIPYGAEIINMKWGWASIKEYQIL